MATTFDLYFNSGAALSATYSEGDNVSLIQISNSDQDYYQNGSIQLYNVPSTQSIGDTCMVKINDTLQFNGYVSTTQKTINAGKLFTTFQLIGKTYDLWRYHTDSNTVYSGATSFIASSLVADFCTGISSNIHEMTVGGSPTGRWSGTIFDEPISFPDTIIGDALTQLVGYDNYRFYVDDDDTFHYYKPSVRSYDFTVTEDNILDMTPIEESDEDIINDVTIKGSTSGYTTKTDISSTHPSSCVFPSGVLVAQRFKAEDNRLSAVKLYLNRTLDPNQPGGLTFEIWNDSSKQLFEDDFSDASYISYSSNTYINDDYLTLSYEIETESQGTSTTSVSNWYVGQTFEFGSSRNIYDLKTKFGDSLGTSTYWCWICNVNGGDEPDFTSQLTSGSVIHTGSGYGLWTCTFTFNHQVKLDGGTKYAAVFTRDANPVAAGKSITVYGGGAYGDGVGYTSVDASSWASTSDRYFVINGRTYQTNGFASSNVYDNDCQYINVDVGTIVSSCRFYISATNDGGANWSSIITTGATAATSWNSSNKWWDFGSESSDGTCIKYIFSSTGYFTPRITESIVSIGDAKGSSSGSPESGNAVEFGDDISPWTANTIPYPPSYNSWKSYSDPKLRLTKDRTYWLVMYHNSANSAYWSYYYDPKSDYVDGDVKFSWYGDNYMTGWSSNSDAGMSDIVPSGNLTFNLGWSTAGNITATATNQQSIDSYGRHYKVINDSTITTLEEAQTRADYEVSGMHKAVPKKGSLTINGREDMSVDYRFSSNLTNFGITDIWDVVAYRQVIDKEGFKTEIDYGRHPFDFIRHISELEKEVY